MPTRQSVQSVLVMACVLGVAEAERTHAKSGLKLLTR